MAFSVEAHSQAWLPVVVILLKTWLSLWYGCNCENVVSGRECSGGAPTGQLLFPAYIDKLATQPLNCLR